MYLTKNLFVGPLAYVFLLFKPLGSILVYILNDLLNTFFYNILLKGYFTIIIISQLLKKSEKGEESSTEKPKERGEEIDTRDGKQELGPSCAVMKPKPLESSLQELREK